MSETLRTVNTKNTNYKTHNYTLTEAPCPIAPVAMKVVEVSDADMAMQREPVKVLPVGTRVQVKANGQLYEDGVVIDFLHSGRIGVRAGSVKVWYNAGRSVKLFSPRAARDELFPVESGPCPPLLPFGAVGQLSLKIGDNTYSQRYVELYGGYLNWWHRYEDAEKGGKPARSVRLNTKVWVEVYWAKDEYVIRDFISPIAVFSIS